MRAGAALAVASVAGWEPVALASTLTAPPGFPQSLDIQQRAYRNWSGQVSVDSVWTCTPRTAEDIVRIANWARNAGWTVRPRGQAHGWSPFILRPGQPGNTVLLDLREHFTEHWIAQGAKPSVTAQAGLLLEDLLARLQDEDLGVTAGPAPGDLTVGGMVAVGAHGTGISPAGGQRTGRYGSLSNLVTSLKAVVWDPELASYQEKLFTRDDPAMAVLLVNLGRVIVTEATFAVCPNRRLHCRSLVDIPASEIFAAPEQAGENSFARLLDVHGSAEVIWFPYTINPWLKIWSEQPSAPSGVRQVSAPYNYGFSDSLPDSVTGLLDQVTAGALSLTPSLMNMLMSVVSGGLLGTGALDIWGWSKDVLLYVRPTTLRVTANGYAVLTRRRDLQRVVSDFHQMLGQRLAVYQQQAVFPMNGPLEVRVTELDDPRETGIPGAQAAELSAIKPSREHPEFDVAVWFDVLTVPGTRGSDAFFREVESWTVSHYSGDYALVRPEWSKGWAYGSDGAWSDEEFMRTTIPAAIGLDGWSRIREQFDQLDPHQVFAGDMHRALLGE